METESVPVIAIGNQKGGAGKSTTAVHLAAALGRRGRRCLVIDLDPFAGATKHLGVAADRFAGALELLTSDEALASLVITDGMPEGVSLVPSRTQLADIEDRLSKYSDRTQLLERALADARRSYDFVLLDTSPSAGFTTTVAAYSSADWFLLTALPHPLSLAGLTEAFRDIADVRRHRNSGLEVLGVLLNCVDRRATRLRSQVELALHEAMPGRLFATAIPQAVVVQEVSGRGLTVFQDQKAAASDVAEQYVQLSLEVEHRVRHRAEFLAGTLGSAPPSSAAPALLSIANQ